jgi:hypothetical protein
VRGTFFEELLLSGDKSNQKRLVHRLQVAASGHSKNVPRATKPMGKRLPREERYIASQGTADDGGGSFACAVNTKAACGLLQWKCSVLHQFVRTYKFPLQEGTARQKNITHAKPAPDYLCTPP